MLAHVRPHRLQGVIPVAASEGGKAGSGYDPLFHDGKGALDMLPQARPLSGAVAWGMKKRHLLIKQAGIPGCA